MEKQPGDGKSKEFIFFGFNGLSSFSWSETSLNAGVSTAHRLLIYLIRVQTLGLLTVRVDRER